MAAHVPSITRRLFGDSAGDFLDALLAQETFAGFVLVGALLVGVLWATLGAASYEAFVTAPVHLPSVPQTMVHNVETLVTNALMVLFFGAIGLEIARERAVGALKDPVTAVAPVVAALGGMAMAAVTYLVVLLIEGNHGAMAGWGIPMATDVAFTLGALSLLGSRVSKELRVFLLTLAVADDVASVLVLGLTSHNGTPFHPVKSSLLILGALACIALVFVARKVCPRAWVFIASALLLWWILAQLGIEPTLAGVIVGVLVPMAADPQVVGLKLERVVAPLSTFVVLPLFAIAVGGVDLAAKPWVHHGGFLLALLLARSLGKIVGIVGGVALVVRFGIGALPSSTSWRQLSGAALLCGIGFTVPLLFATNTFSNSPGLIAATKVGLLLASVLCGVLGLSILALTKSPRLKEAE